MIPLDNLVQTLGKLVLQEPFCIIHLKHPRIIPKLNRDFTTEHVKYEDGMHIVFKPLRELPQALLFAADHVQEWSPETQEFIVKKSIY